MKRLTSIRSHVLQVLLLYESVTNVLTTRLFSDGQWLAPRTTGFVNLNGSDTFANSRALSINWIPASNYTELLVAYEFMYGNITFLHGLLQSKPNEIPTDTLGDQSWIWGNVTNEIYSSLVAYLASEPSMPLLSDTDKPLLTAPLAIIPRDSTLDLGITICNPATTASDC